MLPESNRNWSLVSSGGQRSYQCSRTQSSFSCHQNVSQTPFQHHCVSPHGQYHSRCPHKQQRGYPFPSASQPNSRTMAVVPSKINSDHRSALTRQTQQCGRQRVKRVLRLQRMTNRPTSDPALPKKVQCRSLCITPNGSALNLRQLETRPRGYLHRCNDPRLVPSQRLRLSTIQSDRTSSEKSVSGQSRFGGTLVASPAEPVNQESCHDPKLQTPAEGPCVPSENPSNVSQASSLAVFQLSGNSTKQKGFQRTLPEYCNQQLVPPHIRHTSQPGDYSIAGVLNGKLIQFQPPSRMSFSS